MPAGPVSRRKLLLYGLGTATAAGAGAFGYRAWDKRRRAAGVATRVADRAGYVSPGAVVTQRRRLGRTGLEVSVVAMGAGGLDGTDPIHRAVDKGMNYIDTSPCYGGSENVIGTAIAESPGLRDKLVLATKWDASAHMKKDRILASLDESLKRLKTDHVDVMQIHWLGGGHLPDDDGYNRVDNPELYEAMAAAKQAGKARFFGATSHDGLRSKILRHAIDKGAFDMILVKLNVLDHGFADMPALLAAAKAKDVGVVVMKSQPGGGYIPRGFEQSKWSIYQANLRWALGLDVACVVHSGIGSSPDTQDLAIGAVEDSLGSQDTHLLDRYAEALSPEYCRGCGQICQPACPEGVSIAPVLQFGMYDRQYGWGEYARGLYEALPAAKRWSETCLDCDACRTACPFGVDAPARVNDAKKRLG